MAWGLTYLVDTNLFLELLLDQERAGEVEAFLARTPVERLAISDFSLHSLGIILFQKNRHAVFTQVVVEDLLASGLSVLTVKRGDLTRVTETAEKFELDFDDAYQYCVAEKYALTLVSFDRDFDRTDKRRSVPRDLSENGT